ncbi:MAG: glycosyltransferase [Parcubacteria group bacterium]|jgi:glycosyltransferase involved in cell wall biosynthesis
MNIAIFTNNYLPNPYGVTGSIESFRKQFEKSGHTVYIFAPNCKDYKDKNSNVFRYPSLDIQYKIKFPLAIPYSRKIDRIIDNLELDIIHSQHPNLLGSAAKKWTGIKNIPLVFTWHTLYDQYAHFVPLIPNKIASKYIINTAVKYATCADFIITPTDSVKKIIQKWGVTNKNIKAIPTGIEEELYQNADRNKIRNKFNIKDDDILLILVSRISQEKNIEFLFQAIKKVLKADSPLSSGLSAKRVRFLICGDGYLLPKLKKMTRENDLKNKINFESIVPKEELKNYYAAGDIFVYASKSETQGMIISEAMYCGLPIVAVNAPGVCDLVQNNVNGFLTSENKGEFASAVQKLIDDKELRNKFSAESSKIAKENFTDKICAEKMLKVYESLVKK